LNLKGLYNRFSKIKKAKNYISNYIDKHQIDLLYTSTSVIVCGGLAAKKSGIPNIFHIHEIPTGNKLYEIFIGLFARYLSTKVIVVSNSVAKHWHPYLKKNQLIKVYNGIVFPLTKAPNRIKREIGQNITVTSIGRLLPGKGHKYFIEVAKELLKLNNQYQFLIVGDTFSGYESYEEELKASVIENDLHQKIHFLGYRTDIEAILAESDLVFHSSTAPDSLPTILFEAIKMRVPVVATELAGAVEILDNGNCGLLVPLNNAKKVADLINDYYKDEKLKTSNIEKAIEYTNQYFSPTQFHKNILDIFKTTLKSK
jgi:glycosyltransferase involved in cell wall biosynthesis